MGKALSVADCIKQAEECISLAEATSDPQVKEAYVKLASDLTRIAGMLEREAEAQLQPEEVSSKKIQGD